MSITLSDVTRAMQAQKSVLARFDERLKAQDKAFRDLAAKFAYYWYEENKCCLCIVATIHKGTTKADLICFGEHVSGDIEILHNREMVSPDPEWPKLKRWQPIVMPGTKEVTDLLAGAEPVEETEVEPVTADATT